MTNAKILELLDEVIGLDKFKFLGRPIDFTESSVYSLRGMYRLAGEKASKYLEAGDRLNSLKYRAVQLLIIAWHDNKFAGFFPPLDVPIMAIIREYRAELSTKPA